MTAYTPDAMELAADARYDARCDAAQDATHHAEDAAVCAVLKGQNTPGGSPIAEVLACFEYQDAAAYRAFVRHVREFIRDEQA